MTRAPKGAPTAIPEPKMRYRSDGTVVATFPDGWSCVVKELAPTRVAPDKRAALAYMRRLKTFPGVLAFASVDVVGGDLDGRGGDAIATINIGEHRWASARHRRASPPRWRGDQIGDETRAADRALHDALDRVVEKL